MFGSKNLLIGAYYRPPSDKGTSLQQLEVSLSRRNHASNTNIILGGDFNLGHIDWSIWLRKVRQQPRKILRYDKANWDNIKSDLEDTLKKIINIINNDAKSTVNEMWNLFKNNLTESINKKHPT